MTNEKELREAHKYFESKLDYWVKAGATKEQINQMNVLLRFAKSVLAVNGLPEYRTILMGSPYSVEEVESFNEAIDLCRLVIARDYIKKSSVAELVEALEEAKADLEFALEDWGCKDGIGEDRAENYVKNAFRELESALANYRKGE